MKELMLDMHNYPEDAEPVCRTAVRGIVRRGDKYLMVYSRKYGDCKFPGGGQEQGETHADTLRREMREESGFDVLPDSQQEYLVMYERRRGYYGDVLFMDSYYYFCDIGQEQHPQDLQDYEIDEGYEVRWLTLDEALERNQQANHPEKTPWILRENIVIQMLQNEKTLMLAGEKE